MLKDKSLPLLWSQKEDVINTDVSADKSAP